MSTLPYLDPTIRTDHGYPAALGADRYYLQAVIDPEEPSGRPYWSVVDRHSDLPVAVHVHRGLAERAARTLNERHRVKMQERRESARRLAAELARSGWEGEYDRLGARATLGPDAPAEDWGPDDVVTLCGDPDDDDRPHAA